MVKAARVHSIGGYHPVQYEDVQVTQPSEGHVEVRHTAIVATTEDAFERLHHRLDLKYPYTPGVSAVGVITEVGCEILDHQVGERVGYVSAPELGSFCEVITISPKYLIPIPDFLNDEEAATVLYEGLMAWMLVRRVFPVRRGDYVLIHDVTNELGSLSSQWAKYLGAIVLGTKGVDEDVEVSATEDGKVDHLLSHSHLEEKVVNITDGLGVNVVYNCGGKDTVSGSLACLASKGVFVQIGRGQSLATAEIAQRVKSVTLAFPLLRDYVYRREDLLEASSELFSLLKSKVLTFPSKRKFSLQKASDALKHLEKRFGFESVILQPPVTDPKDVPHGS